jgi:hypothetical protein
MPAGKDVPIVSGSESLSGAMIFKKADTDTEGYSGGKKCRRNANLLQQNKKNRAAII